PGALHSVPARRSSDLIAAVSCGINPQRGISGEEVLNRLVQSGPPVLRRHSYGFSCKSRIGSGQREFCRVSSADGDIGNFLKRIRSEEHTSELQSRLEL